MFRWIPTRELELGGSWSDIQLSEDAYHLPEKKLLLYANTSVGRFTISSHLMMIQGLRGADFDGPTPIPQLHPMEDYVLLDISALFRPIPFIEIRLALKNALDADYQAMYGYPMPGRHMMLDLSYLWDRQ